MHSENKCHKYIAISCDEQNDMLNCCSNDINNSIIWTHYSDECFICQACSFNTSIAKSDQVRAHCNNCFQYISQVPLEQIKDEAIISPVDDN